MKKLLLLILFTCSAVHAESKVLPPVVDNSTYPGGSNFGSAAAPSSNVMYEMLGRLEQLQHEVQQLRGVVEEQSQTIDSLKLRQGNIYSDLDMRIQELSGTRSVTRTVYAEDTSQATATPNTAVPAEQQTYSQVSEGQTVAGYSSAETVTKAEYSAGNDKARYQAAYEMLRNGHNSRAISEFKALLAESPAGEFADNSQYWLGEAYKVNQKMDAAKQAFLKVVNEHSGSPKVPDALLKLGFIEFEQKNIAKARDYLTQLTVDHPDTTAAHLATKKLVQMGSMQF